MKDERKWTLTWSGRKNSPSLRAAAEHCRVFPLFKDSQARLIDHKEYKELIDDGEISEALSYWEIDEGEVGLISLSSFEKYTNTWERISSAKSDFEAGWKAAEKHHSIR